jgi:hypothetical protein
VRIRRELIRDRAGATRRFGQHRGPDIVELGEKILRRLRIILAQHNALIHQRAGILARRLDLFDLVRSDPDAALDYVALARIRRTVAELVGKAVGDGRRLRFSLVRREAMLPRERGDDLPIAIERRARLIQIGTRRRIADRPYRKIGGDVALDQPFDRHIAFRARSIEPLSDEITADRESRSDQQSNQGGRGQRERSLLHRGDGLSPLFLIVLGGD